MSYYMRFFIDDVQKIDLDTKETALKRADQGYTLVSRDAADESAELMWKGAIYGEIEISHSSSDLMAEEVEELIDFIDEKGSAPAKQVVQMLREAKCVVAVRVLFQGRSTELTLAKIDPLWEWLFGNYRGLLQADGEGFYDSNELLLNSE
jgi:hypothetical protein